jgi:glucose-6-phosphate 1-epimerase
MREIFQGLVCHRLSLANGDSVLVAEQGAQVLSWRVQGQERLYLSPQSHFDGHTAIRGGVPICFPQFNQRGPDAKGKSNLPKHGFARNVNWRLDHTEVQPNEASFVFSLSHDAQSLALWPQQFTLQFEVVLKVAQLHLNLTVINTDTKTMQFTGALHTYFAVNDIKQSSLLGLQGVVEWDSLRDLHAVAAPILRFGSEFDRVYAAAERPLILSDQSSEQTLQISQSPSWANTVVWNPGPTLCTQLADMPNEGYQHMLCVEAAQVFEPIEIQAGQTWQGWQHLQVIV